MHLKKKSTPTLPPNTHRKLNPAALIVVGKLNCTGLKKKYLINGKNEILALYRQCEKYLCEICVESRWTLNNHLNALLSAVKENCWCWWPFKDSVLGLWCVSNKRTLSSGAFISCIFISLPLINQLCLGGWDLPVSEENLEIYNLIQLSMWGLQGELGSHLSPTTVASCKEGDSTSSEQLQLVLSFFHGQ